MITPTTQLIQNWTAIPYKILMYDSCSGSSHHNITPQATNPIKVPSFIQMVLHSAGDGSLLIVKWTMRMIRQTRSTTRSVMFNVVVQQEYPGPQT